MECGCVCPQASFDARIHKSERHAPFLSPSNRICSAAICSSALMRGSPWLIARKILVEIGLYVLEQ
eukprot:777263-Rhodomonas_salina.3